MYYSANQVFLIKLVRSLHSLSGPSVNFFCDSSTAVHDSRLRRIAHQSRSTAKKTAITAPKPRPGFGSGSRMSSQVQADLKD